MAPTLEVPSLLDLGERELGEEVVTHFTLANRGGSELLIDQVRSSCTCSGLERQENGEYVRVDSLRLQAGEQAELSLRVHVRAKEVGVAMRILVAFRTNDLQRPEAIIEAVIPKVTGGVETWPSCLVFGTIQTGSQHHRVFEIRDNAVERRVVEQVTSSDPEHIAVRLLPLNAPDDGQETRTRPDDRQETRTKNAIARCEVTVQAHKPGSIEGNLYIRLGSGTPSLQMIRVSARVVGPITVSPALLVLPRHAEAGLLYHADCFCRTVDDKSLVLTVKSIPPDLSVKILSDGTQHGYCVRIKWIPKRGELPETDRKVVRLQARIEGSESIVEIPVVCRNERGNR